MTIATVTNDVEHDAALRTIESLLEGELDPKGEKDLGALLALVDAYEKQRWPITDTLDPIGFIKQAMTDEVGHTHEELVQLMGSATEVSLVLAKRRRLTFEHIQAINDAWGIPVSLLAERYELANQTADREGSGRPAGVEPAQRLPAAKSS